MTILFDLTAVYDHLTGIERYAINICKNIIKKHDDNQYILVFKNEVHSEFVFCVKQSNIEIKILKACHKLLFYQWRLMRYLYSVKADRYVFLSFVSPWLFRNKNIINTIHDISAWDCPTSRKWYMIAYGRIGIKNAIHLSKKIMTVSEFSKERIINRLRAQPYKVEVAYNGVSEQFVDLQMASKFRNEKLYQKYNIPSKYILCLSTLEPRKNMKLLIKAYQELLDEGKIDIDLVLVGRKGWKLKDAIGECNQLDRHIHLTGFVADEDIPFIYKNAEIFVFPSLYEGFGIPIIEAMSQGTLVIASDSSSLPEVVGDAGFLFENNSKDSLKKTILRALELSKNEREELQIKGFERSRCFNWNIEAEKYYHNIMM